MPLWDPNLTWLPIAPLMLVKEPSDLALKLSCAVQLARAALQRAHRAFGGKADIAVNFALSRSVKTPDGFCFVVILPDGFAATASRHRGLSRNKPPALSCATTTASNSRMSSGRDGRFRVSNFAQTPSSYASKCSKRSLKCGSFP